MLQPTMNKLNSFEKYMKSFNGKISVHEQAQKESDEALELLQKESRELYQKTVENSEKLTELEAGIEAKFQALTTEMNKVAVQLQVSEQSSKGDLARLNTLLRQVMQDLGSEVSARGIGDKKVEHTIMLRVQSLISEIKTMEIKSQQKASSSSSTCSCSIKYKDGEKTSEAPRSRER